MCWSINVLSLFLILSCIITVHGQYQCVQSDENHLKSNVPPGTNFNLSNWYLTLPNEDATIVEPNNLTQGYTSSFFYTDPDDGSMSFFCPTEGGKTPNGHFPRSELRQLCKPSEGNSAAHWNFFLNGEKGHYHLYETVRIDPNRTANGTIVAQIHAYNWHPLIMIFWWDIEGGLLQAKYQLDATGSNETWANLTSGVGYDPFDVYIGVDSSVYSVTVAINNKKVLTIYVEFWKQYGNYFKHGNYIQDTVTGRYLITHTYCLNVTLEGDYSCVYTEEKGARKLL